MFMDNGTHKPTRQAITQSLTISLTYFVHDPTHFSTINKNTDGSLFTCNIYNDLITSILQLNANLDIS